MVEFVETYKYLGSLIDNKLTFISNTEMLCKRGQQRLFCLRKLSKFRVDKTLMTLFYKSYIESVLTFSLICWYGSLTVKAKTALSNIVKVSSKIIGVQQSSLSVLYDRQVVRKANAVISDSSHPLHSEFQILPSGSRYGLPPVKINRDISIHSSREPSCL